MVHTMVNYDISIGVTKRDVLDFAKERFNAVPEYLWQKYPEYAVLRCNENKKWYAVLMNVENAKLGFDGGGKTDVMAVKCDPQARDILLHETGVIPAYHMNKEHWICVLLSGTVRRKLAFGLLEESFDLVKPKVRKKTVFGENP